MFSRLITLCLVLGTPAILLGAEVPEDSRQRATEEIKKLGGKLYPDQQGKMDIISLDRTKVTDDQLKLLQVFPELRKLSLNETTITDQGLEHLYALPKLEEVSLKRTQVTPAAAEAFKQKHPGVYFVELSPGFEPTKLLLSGIFLIPMAFGVWLLWLTRRKARVLGDDIYGKGLLYGIGLIVVSLLLMVISILRAFGFEITVSNLFG